MVVAVECSFLRAFVKFRNATVRFVVYGHVSVRLTACVSTRSILASTGQVFMKFGILIFFANLPRKFKFH